MVRVEERYPGKIMEELREQKKVGPSPELRRLLMEALRDEESGYSLYSKIHDTILSEGTAGWAELDELDRMIDKILVDEHGHMEALKNYMRKWKIIP
jgi:rubrerythrin